MDEDTMRKILGAAIIDVREIEQGDDAEWMAYEILIETNRGCLRISGNHDQGPEYEWESALGVKEG